MFIRKAARVLMVMVAALIASSASAVDFHGYFRSGMGTNSAGGGQVCFQAPGTDYKMRLGNECSTYGEFDLSAVAFEKDGVQFIPHVFFDFETQSAQGGEKLNMPAWDTSIGQGSFELGRAWIEAKGLPFLSGGIAWAGIRAYQGHSVGPIDWTYWDAGGPGFGVESVDLGVGKLSIAVFQYKNGAGTPDPVTGVAKPDDGEAFYRPDVRLANIQIYPNGTIEIGAALWILSNNGTKGHLVNGRQVMSPMGTLEWVHDKLLGGKNTLAFQVGTGSWNGIGKNPVVTGTSDDMQWRVIENLQIQPTPEFDVTIWAVYQDKKAADTPTVKGGSTAFGAGVRPGYRVSEYFKLQGDFGYQQWKAKADGAVTSSLFKATVCPTIVGGGAELRLFATYAGWTDDTATVATALGTTVASGVFGNNRSGITFGAQAETSW